jgi:AcrR family transcriptional regulator
MIGTHTPGARQELAPRRHYCEDRPAKLAAAAITTDCSWDSGSRALSIWRHPPLFKEHGNEKNEMEDQSPETRRKPRADARRNRERLLQAAKTVFRAGGPEASLEAVARRAGVGIGTLYRHFPTREALFEAVYRREVQQLWELAEQLKTESTPVDALRRWLRSNVEFVATKKGMSAALALAVHRSSDLHAYTFEQLTKAVGALLNRAIAAGEIRSDVSPEDLLRALVGMCYMHDQPGWQASVMRLVDVFVDGLRIAGTAKNPTSRKRRPVQRAKRCSDP